MPSGRYSFEDGSRLGLGGPQCGAAGEPSVARYRLRFLLQEFDLPRGATILGRSSDCHVTIEDPLVSRHHARIVLEGDRAVVYDLNSRNGVKVNGAAVKDPVELKDGDRLRIGTQELVFCRVEAAPNASAKTTGFLRHCARCRMPYPQEAGACPELRRDRGARRGDPERSIRRRRPADLERAALPRGARPRAHPRAVRGRPPHPPARDRAGRRADRARATPSTLRSSPSSRSEPPARASRSTTRPGPSGWLRSTDAFRSSCRRRSSRSSASSPRASRTTWPTRSSSSRRYVRTVPSSPAEGPAIAALERVRASVAPMAASKPALS